jgi:hypothetical protein
MGVVTAWMSMMPGTLFAEEALTWLAASVTKPWATI